MLGWPQVCKQIDLSIQTFSLLHFFFYDFISSYLAGAESKSWHFLAERQSETAVTLEILFTFLPPDTHSITSVGHAWWLLFIQLTVLSAPPIDGEAERVCFKPPLLSSFTKHSCAPTICQVLRTNQVPYPQGTNSLLREDRHTNIHHYTSRASVGRGMNGVTWEHRKHKD